MAQNRRRRRSPRHKRRSPSARPQSHASSRGRGVEGLDQSATTPDTDTIDSTRASLSSTDRQVIEKIANSPPTAWSPDDVAHFSEVLKKIDSDPHLAGLRDDTAIGPYWRDGINRAKMAQRSRPSGGCPRCGRHLHAGLMRICPRCGRYMLASKSGKGYCQTCANPVDTDEAPVPDDIPLVPATWSVKRFLQVKKHYESAVCRYNQIVRDRRLPEDRVIPLVKRGTGWERKPRSGGRPRKLTDNLLQRVRRLLALGWSNRRVAHEVKLSARSIGRAKKTLGLTRKTSVRNRTVKKKRYLKKRVLTHRRRTRRS